MSEQKTNESSASTSLFPVIRNEFAKKIGVSTKSWEILSNFVARFLNDTLMSTQMMQQTIADYFKTQPIQRAWLFGSYARGDESPLSDVDILVQFDEGGVSLLKHAAMICELEKILDRPVDIVPEKMLRPRVRESVDQDKKLIYERTR